MASLPDRPRGRSTGRAVMAIGLAALIGIAGPGGPGLPQARAQTAPQPAVLPGAEAMLTQPQLEQLLAPIALYPDPLLAQLLMAATYPMEVVQAARWLTRGSNASLRGDALAAALRDQAWDPSVKSLVPFPEVLAMMNDQLEWTQQLGDAVLAQQDDVFNAVQVLRGRARDAGKLESGPQQTVNVSQSVTVAAPPAAAGAAPARAVAPPPQVITIEPAQPEVVFVPAYDPTVVFGPWPYPTYPPVYHPPPPAWGLGNALLTGMAFAAGTAVVGSLWGWARPGWRGGYVDVDVNRVNNINVNRNQVTANRWQHDVTHRQGVAYRNDTVRNRYQGDRVDRGVAARDEFRGRTGLERPAGGPGERAPGDRPGGGLGDRVPGDRPGGSLGDRVPGDRPGAGLADRLPADRPGGGATTLPATRPGAGDRPGGGLADRVPADRPGGSATTLPATRPAPGSGLADRVPGERPGGAATLPAQRPPTGERPAAASRPAPGHTPSGRPVPTPQPAARPAPGPQALQGLGQGADVRAAAQRGQASRQTPVSRPTPTPTARPAPGAAGGRPAGAGFQGGGGNRPAPQAMPARGGGGGGRAAAAAHGGGGRLGR